LVAAVPAGNTARAKVVGNHLQFMVDGLHGPMAGIGRSRCRR
jgi:hypothetical protein